VTLSLPRLHAVTDDRVVAGGWGRLVERASAMAAVAGPALAVHLRSRALAGRALLDLARALKEAIAPHGSWLAVNDRADVARAAGAEAVVSGRAGLTVHDLRRVAPSAMIGRSVHDAREARAAADEAADFLIAGAVYATPSHPDVPPAGPDLVRVAAALGRPVVAIGGMTAERTTEAVAAGAWGVAAIRALWDANDPAGATREFLGALPGRGGIALVVNGASRSARAGSTLAELLAELGLDARAVVVEHNRRIVRRDALAGTALAEGDAIELVHFVGGG
jgi:thiamine-phosphate pyrophosphorylase